MQIGPCESEYGANTDRIKGSIATSVTHAKNICPPASVDT